MSVFLLKLHLLFHNTFRSKERRQGDYIYAKYITKLKITVFLLKEYRSEVRQYIHLIIFI